MNRAKKEEANRQANVRIGLTSEQIATIDANDIAARKLAELAAQIHLEKFSEEYDFMYDSSWDAHDRKNGINPMKQEYIDAVNSRRAALGVSPLSESGMPMSGDSRLLCDEEARRLILESELGK